MSTHEHIAAKLPHRFENLLLDECSETGEFNVLIDTNDVLNRDFFLKQRLGKTVLCVPLLMEITALAAIVSSGGVKAGQSVYFAAITNFTNNGYHKAGSLISGTITPEGEKGGFYKFSSTIESDNGSGEGSMMAFFTEGEQEVTEKEAPSPLPSYPENTAVAPYPYKSDALMTVHSQRQLDLEEGAIVCGYTYPTDHPLIKGHFPSEPVMMGVMQWMMVEDAVSLYCQRLLENGHNLPETVNCNATIYKADGTLVAEVKKVGLDVLMDDAGNFEQAEVRSTKKIMFRDKVIPGDELVIELNISP